MEEYIKAKTVIVRAVPVDGLNLLGDHLQHLQSHRSLVRGDLCQEEKDFFFNGNSKVLFHDIEHYVSETYRVGASCCT